MDLKPLLCPYFCKKKNPDEPCELLWENVAWLKRPQKSFSPILLRILVVNAFALAFFVGSLLYLGYYKEKLIDAEMDSLMMQARLTTSALAEGAVVQDRHEQDILSPLLSRLMISRLSDNIEARIRLYDLDDTLIADTSILLGGVRKVPLKELECTSPFHFLHVLMNGFDFLEEVLSEKNLPLYPSKNIRNGEQFPMVARAKVGEGGSQVWRMENGKILLSVALPVQRYRHVLGVVMLTQEGAKITKAISDVRMDILQLFGVALLISILMSFYLSHTIATPLQKLARAADLVHKGQGISEDGEPMSRGLQAELIPDFSERRDEIGALSRALRRMTEALAKRMGAIENFAADVSHEIKNPLTSLRSAVETIQKVKDPAQKQKLLEVIRQDVIRMDRLVSDISNASRLDSEMPREAFRPVHLVKMLNLLEDFYDARKGIPQARVRLALPEKDLCTMGVEGRLVRVVQNLVGNALSFAPEGSEVVVSLREKGREWIDIIVEDSGPGLPENKREAIFDRFYSERPKTEKFGAHSGLGLSISRQIVVAHYGRIWAENRRDEKQNIIGARFIVRLPRFEPTSV